MKNLLFLFAILLPVFGFGQKKKKDEAPNVYDLIVGTYTRPEGSKGISVYRFYAETGKVSYLSQIDGVDNPTYLCISADRKYVYSVNANPTGEVSAFNFDYNSGALKFINKQPSVGAGPSHVIIDKESKNVVVSNYTNGTLSVLPVNKDGSLAPATQTIIGQGSSINKQRQAGSHIHSAIFSPDEKFLIYADLGTDKLYINKYKSGKIPPLTPADVATEQVKPGNGPRHMDFSADGKFLYLVSEMGAAVNAYTYDKGKLAFLDSASLAAPGFTGRNSAADIHLSPDGRFLYATNRGTANELIVFTVDRLSGKIKYLTRYPTGQEPRNFVIEPGGRFLLLANQNSNNIQVYKIEKATGYLTPFNTTIAIQAPTCLKLVSAE